MNPKILLKRLIHEFKTIKLLNEEVEDIALMRQIPIHADTVDNPEAKGYNPPELNNGL
ncbi:MAG: hypothetical protein ACETWK_11895 [Candidatus Aminicenantaceae bacterium]